MRSSRLKLTSSLREVEMSEFRLHLANPEREFTPLPELEAALAYWREMEASNWYWASFEVIQFKHELVIRVDVGVTYNKGTVNESKERAIKTRSYSFFNGQVEYYDAAHT
jgi:hypothetical protein